MVQSFDYWKLKKKKKKKKLKVKVRFSDESNIQINPLYGAPVFGSFLYLGSHTCKPSLCYSCYCNLPKMVNATFLIKSKSHKSILGSRRYKHLRGFGWQRCSNVLVDKFLKWISKRYFLFIYGWDCALKLVIMVILCSLVVLPSMGCLTMSRTGLF